ncbi:hypothetical protein SAMN04487948_10429 [Halogranum amylolyticum]|uniref:Big-1 domain-containing protein n=1 Tax=Halogranum amylolyticum TaxID=660520 RepID=A0A1H8RHS0_9EURY|nr:Ig-like domain-containing protein [Halogranum amylolyticum]SEO65955.1 hypothetical protein SAMN04487948_10429 [Halogranum amylolyticum]
MTVYENGALYNEFSVTNRVPQSGQTLVDGRRISLVVVDGDLSRSQTGTLGVDVRPTSVSDRTVTVEAEGGPLTVAVASTLSEETWRDQLLDGEYDENGPDAANGEPDDGRYVVDVTKTDGVVELTLESGYDYELNLAKVGVGTDVAEPTPTYLTGVDGETVSENGERRVVAEVRDEFDNPVSGVTVNASVDGPGTVTSTAVSGSDGRAAFTYTPEDVDGQRSATVTAAVGASLGAKERVEFDLSVVDSDGSGGGSGRGAEINPGDPGSVVQRGATIENGGRVAVTLENTDGERRRVVEAVRFNFYSQDSQGGAGTDPPTRAVFGDGEATLPVRGAYRDVSVPLEAGGNRTLSFAFDDRQGQRHRVDEGDFFVFSVLYDDGDAATYFVAPEKRIDSGGNGN